MSRSYRDDALESYTYNDIKECGLCDEEFVLVKNVEKVLDFVESDVKRIIDLLHEVKGLTEIDEVKEKLDNLLTELF